MVEAEVDMGGDKRMMKEMGKEEGADSAIGV